MFIFVFQLTVNPLVSLLVMGCGRAGIPSGHPSLLDAVAELQKQVECDKDDLEKIRDSVAIDHWLAKQSKIFAIDNVDVVALSFHNPRVSKAGGGVMGSPFEKLRPAQGQMEFITKDICIIACPEGPGVVLMGIEQDLGESFAATLNRLDKKTKTISTILNLAEETTAKAAMVMQDGCGVSETGGGFYIKKSRQKKTYVLEECSVNGNCRLEVYICDNKYDDPAN